MRGYTIKITDIVEGKKQEYLIIKGGYVIENTYNWLLQDDLYKSVSSAKRALTQYKSHATIENPNCISSYDIVEIE